MVKSLRLRAVVRALAVLWVVSVVGCAAQSQMTEVWREPSIAANPIHNVLVVGIRRDPVRRRLWEDALVGALRARGVTANPSYQQFADAPPDTEQVIAAVRSAGYDAVLTSVRLPDEVVSQYIPGETRLRQVRTRDYYGSFHRDWVNVQEPGYTETDVVVQVQTDVWATLPAPGRLIWSGTMRTLESVGNTTIDRVVTEKIMPELEKHQMVPRRTR